MLGSHLDKILAERNKAVKVLVSTQEKLKKTVEKANLFISQNETEITKKENEIKEKKDLIAALKDQQEIMTASISETERIINPYRPKVAVQIADEPVND